MIDRIIAAARLQGDERVVEIGPGRGALTERLLDACGKLLVCEVDPELIQYWQERNLDRLQLVAGDVLELDWETLFTEPPYTLVSNLPYNISTPILFQLMAHRTLFKRLVLMFQREVAERLLAEPGNKDYGILTVLCRVWYDISKVTLVKPGAFFPPPKVESMVLAFDPLSEPRVAVGDWETFRRVVKAAFAQRRKALRNTLCSGGWARPSVEEALSEAEIDPGRRAETLSLEEFSRLAAALATR